MDAQAVKVWLGDGTNYPGQDDLRGRHRRLVEGLPEVYPHLPDGVRLYLEYKLYEPALYSTDVQDWGQALNVCRALGEQAGVCVDTGHHAMGVNIEQIVALLLAEGRLGGFDLNDKKYGDDDLMVGSIDPYQLFRIAHELVNAMRDDADPVAQAMRERDRLHARPVPQHRAQGAGDDPDGDEPPGDDRQGAPRGPRRAAARRRRRATCWRRTACLQDAFSTDVRPLLAELRAARGLPADPYRAYLASGEGEAQDAARVGGTAAELGLKADRSAAMAISEPFPGLDELLESIGEGPTVIVTGSGRNTQPRNAP